MKKTVGPQIGVQCNRKRGWHGIKGHCKRLKGRDVKEVRSESLNAAKAKLGISGEKGREMAIAARGPMKDQKKVAAELVEKIKAQVKVKRKSAPSKMPKPPSLTVKTLSLPDDGEMMKPYKGQIKADGTPDLSMAKVFAKGGELWEPAIVTGGKNARAIGPRSNKIISSLNSGGSDSAKAWTVQVPDNPKDLKSAESLQVPDKKPYTKARGKTDSFSDVGQYLRMYSEDVSAEPGGHTGTAAQVKKAAKDLKAADRNWVPVLVKKDGDAYKVVGNHFAYAAAKEAGISRVWTVLTDD